MALAQSQMVRNIMPNTPPHFKFLLKTSAKDDLPCIELDGEVIHTITDLGEFYKYLGYSPEIALKGVLPDEFIWGNLCQRKC